MADSENVLSDLDPPDDVEIIGIVVNESGAERAIATDSVQTLGFPYSLSPTFLKNNQNQTLEESLDVLEKVKLKADDAGLDTVVYISMAFGNPYGDLWNADELVDDAGDEVRRARCGTAGDPVHEICAWTCGWRHATRRCMRAPS